MATHELTPNASQLADRQNETWRQPPIPGPAGPSRLTGFLGWFSIGLGVTELVAPGVIRRISGTTTRKSVVRLFGVRELAAGIGILTQPKPAKWLWARVAGDAADAATIVRNTRRGHRGAAIGSLATVAAVAALDIRCAKECITNEKSGPRMERAEASLLVSRSRQECYRFWRNVANIPRFASDTISVQTTGDRTSEWTARLPGGAAQFQWAAEITEDVPDERIAWRTTLSDGVRVDGAVVFEPAPGGRGTIVRVQMDYDHPGRIAATPLSRIFGKHPRQIIYKSLRRFKQLMEVGEILTTEGQPAGRQASTTWLDAIAH